MFKLILISVLLIGCSVQTVPKEDDVNNALNNLAYGKDKHGICYAMINSMGHNGYESISITAVPCDKVGL